MSRGVPVGANIWLRCQSKKHQSHRRWSIVRVVRRSFATLVLEAHVAPIEAVLRLLGMLGVSAEPQIANDDEPEEADETSTDPDSTVRPRQELTWVETALQVLPGGGGSLHVRDIVRLVREEGLRDLSNARTPEATLRRDLRQESQREKPKVTQTAPSPFATAS